MIIPASGLGICGDCERIEKRLNSKSYYALREFHFDRPQKNRNLPVKIRAK